MEILDKFGFSPELFIAQIINFLILAFVFKKFLYGPILKTLHERKLKIEKGLEDAQRAQQDREAAEEERNEIIKKATKEAEKILKETREAADTIRVETVEKARAESTKILDDARSSATAEIERMQKSLQASTLTLAEKILESAINDAFSKDEKEKIIKRNLRNIK